jgi:hypothetical protein
VRTNLKIMGVLQRTLTCSTSSGDFSLFSLSKQAALEIGVL